MAFGKKLRNARLKKKMTASQVAAATQMMVQIVEDLEREDFGRIAAPIYGKGFIKLYARCVGLDPKPLVDEYVSRFVIDTTPSLASEAKPEVPGAQDLETFADRPKIDFSRLRSFTGKIIDRLVRRLVHRSSDSARDRSESGSFSEGRAVSLWEKGLGMLREKLKYVRGALQKCEFNLPEIRFAESPLKFISVVLGILIILVFLVSGLSRCIRRPKLDTISSVEQTREQLRLAIEPPPPYLD